MKNLILKSFFCIICNSCWGQATIYQVCETKLENMLIKDELIKPSSTKKNEKEFYSHIKGIYKRLLPEDSGLAAKEIKLYFPSKSLDKIFTTTFVGELSTTAIDNISSYELPQPLNFLPVYLLNMQADHFKLNLNSSNTLAQALDVKFDGNASIVESRASTALKNSIKSQTNFDVFYGQFENRIGKLFFDLQKNDAPIIGNEWNPLFELWNLYYSQEEFRENYKNYNVVRRFYGMIISTSNRQSMSNSNEIKSMIKLNYNYMGLAGIDSNYDFEWSKSKDAKLEQKNFNVYMINEPEFPINITPLPEIDKIKLAWELRRDNICNVIYPREKSYIALNGNSFELTVHFGPIPSDYIHKPIGISPDVLVESITAIEYQPTDESINSKGTGKYTMKVNLKKDEINRLQSIHNQNGEIEKEITIIFGLGDIGNVNNRLAYTYKIPIKIDLKPYPEIINFKLSENITSQKIGSKIEYKIPLKYKIIRGSESLSLINARISNISISDNGLNKKATSNATNQYSTVTESGFTDTLSLIVDTNAITNENLIQDLIVTFNFKEGSINYSKKAHLKVVFPENKEESALAKSAKTYSEDLKTVYYNDLDLTKLDSTYTIKINDKILPISKLLLSYRNNPDSQILTVNNETIETKAALFQISDELVKKKVISPTSTNKKGILLRNSFRNNQ